MKSPLTESSDRPGGGIQKVVIDGDDIAQFEPGIDKCRCKLCKSMNPVNVLLDAGYQSWECVKCGHLQEWIPSEKFIEDYQFGSKPAFFKKPEFSTNPNKDMGKMTLDALAKMDRGDVEKMSTTEALEALLACDTAAGGLNEVIGMAAQKGYNTEFVSGVIADIGKLRDLKQLLHDKLEQEVV